MRALSILTFFLVSMSLSAMTEAEAMAKTQMANAHYANGEIEDAIATYRAVAEEFDSPQVNYNIGNCYYRLNQIPKAILYYERALRSAPENDDILHNLNQARLQTVDKMENEEGKRFSDLWRSILLKVGHGKWASFSVLFALLALVGGILYLYLRGKGGRKSGIYLGIGATVLCFLFFWFSISSKGALLRTSDAIIMTAKVEVMSAPNPVSTELLILHQGTKVEVLRESDEWYEVRLPNGKEGWLEIKDLMVI